MPATLVKAPPPIAFSLNPIEVKIQGSNWLSVAGVKAVNVLHITGNTIAAGAELTFTWGAISLKFKASDTPDDSGLSFPTGDFSSGSTGQLFMNNLLSALKNNFLLNRDFIITYPGGSGVDLVLTGRADGSAYNLAPVTIGGLGSISVTTAGVTQALQPNFGNFVEVWLETLAGSNIFEKIHEKKIELDYPYSGISTYDISGILHSHLTLTLPDQASAVPAVCTTCKRRYYLQIAESYGTIPTVKKLIKSINYHVTLGGLSYQGQVNKTLTGILKPVPGDPTRNKFLKQGDISRKVRKNQPEFLYFLAMAAYASISLKARAMFSDASTVDVTVAKGATAQYDKLCFNTSFLKLFNPATYPTKTIISYEVWLVDGATQVTEKRTYVLDYEAKNYVRFFGAESSFGSFDPFMTFGKGSNELEIFKQSAEISKPAVYSLAHGERVDYGVEIQDTFSVATGWLTLPGLLLMRDFYASEKQFRLKNGDYLPISVTSKKIPEKPDGTGLHAQKFDYQYQFKDHVYTESDNEEAETYITPPISMLIYYGPDSSAAITAASIEALPYSTNLLSFTMPTGNNKRWRIAFPDYQSLARAYDNDTAENLLANYGLTNLVIDGQNYKVGTMENAIAYSSNHQQQIEITNNG